jgi:hypothetical protein
MSIFVLGFMALYFIMAVIAVLLVWNWTSRKLYRWLAVAIAILLPSWDAVLSAAFFYTACPFFSKAEIYETVETEGIYYEGDYYNRILIINTRDEERVATMPLADRTIDKGYQYAEYLVTKKKEGSYGAEVLVSPAVVYRCVALHRDPQWPWNIPFKCMPVEEVRSKYAVKSISLEFLLVTMNIMEIHDRANGRLMAEYRGISKHPYAGVPFYPFFTWLNWYNDTFKANEYVHCPEKSQFFEFQYEVLKVKK